MPWLDPENFRLSIASPWFRWVMVSSVFTAVFTMLFSIGLRGVDALTSIAIRSLILPMIIVPIWLKTSRGIAMPGKENILPVTLTIAAGVISAVAWYALTIAVEDGQRVGVPSPAIVAINSSSLVILALLFPLQRYLETRLATAPKPVPPLSVLNIVGMVLVFVGLVLVLIRPSVRA